MIRRFLVAVAVVLGVAHVVSSVSESSYSYSYSYDVFQMRPCAYDDKFYMHGQKWNPYPCATCVCKNLNSVCTMSTCPICEGDYTPPSKTECCGRCNGRRVEPTEKDFCYWKGKTYQEGQSFALNECTDCQCYSGKGRCVVRSCLPANCKNPIVKEGACCETCPHD